MATDGVELDDDDDGDFELGEEERASAGSSSSVSTSPFTLPFSSVLSLSLSSLSPLWKIKLFCLSNETILAGVAALRVGGV